MLEDGSTVFREGKGAVPLDTRRKHEEAVAGAFAPPVDRSTTPSQPTLTVPFPLMRRLSEGMRMESSSLPSGVVVKQMAAGR